MKWNQTATSSSHAKMLLTVLFILYSIYAPGWLIWGGFCRLNFQSLFKCMYLVLFFYVQEEILHLSSQK